MENDLISVLIPAYNHEKYIVEAVDSIIAQAYKNLELIIIDDGSKDNTWQLINDMIAKCEQRFVKFTALTQPNQGVCVTMNNLLQLAQGKYTYLIASDDKAKPQAIEKLYAFLSQHDDYALAVGNNEFIDGDSKLVYWDKDSNPIYDKKTAAYLTFADFLQTVSHVNFHSDEFGRYSSICRGNHIPNGYLVRKSIYAKTGLYTTEAPLEDYYMMMQLSKYTKLKFIDEVLFCYRWHSSNTVKQKDKISDYTRRTLQFELANLEKSDCSAYVASAQDFIKNGIVIKSYINLPWLLQIYKLRTLKEKQTIVKVFGFPILVKRRPLSKTEY